MTDWADVRKAVVELDDADPGIVQNALDLIELLSLTVPPAELDRGYWPTIRFGWPGVEIEVFDDHYERYRFPEGAVDVRYFNRRPGETMPSELLREFA